MSSSPAPEYDFFISYTGADVGWAEWIAWQLEEMGHKTVLQAWDFKSGGVFPGDMHRALQQSTRVIAVLTPAYMASVFCQPEWQAAFADDPTGEKGLLVGIRVADFKPDGILRGRTYIDLVGKSSDDAKALLLERLKRGRAKPATAPAHPGFIAPGTVSIPPAFPSIVTGPSNLPGGYIGRLFLGRDEFLDQIHQSLWKQSGQAGSGPGATAITQKTAATGIAGLGGIGKTHAAVEYAHRHAGDYCARLFISGDSPEKLRSSLAGLCGVLQLDAQGDLPPDESARVDRAVHWLASHPGWLLIVDNVDDAPAAQALTDLLEKLTPGHVLITSRLHGWADNVESLDIEVLSDTASADLLLQLTEKARRKTPEDPAQARRLAVLLEGLPLALHQAAGYINEQRLTLAAYLSEYETEAADLLGWFNALSIPYERPDKLAPRPVLITWKTSFDKLDANTRLWLLVFAHFAADPIPEFLLTSSPKANADLKFLYRNARQALAQAETYCLLTRQDDPPRFKLHRLVQQILRLTAEPAETTSALNIGIGLFNAGYPGPPQDVDTWVKWTPLQSHAASLCTYAPDELATERLSWLLGELSLLLQIKGLYSEAEPLIRRALKLDETRHGPNHPDVASRLNNLATLLKSTNQLGQAEPLMRRALAIDEKSYGPYHPNVARNLNNLAQLLQATNRLGEAESLMRRALAIDESNYGSNHSFVARDLNNLATLLKATNRLGEAEPLLVRGVAILENSGGKPLPNYSGALNNLAQLLQATNRLGEAEPLMRRALSIDESSYGPNHPTVAIRLSNLAALLQVTNRLDEAEPLYRRALVIDESSYGPDHPELARDLNNLAQLLHATKRLDEADHLYQRALRIIVASLGLEHPNSQTVRGNYIALLQAMDLDEAAVKARVQAVLRGE